MNILGQNVVFGVGERFNLWSLITENYRKNVLVLASKRMLDSGKISEFLPMGEVQAIAVASCEPTLSMVQKIREAVGEKKISAVIAIGGGSVIDCGKLCAIYLESSNRNYSLQDIFYDKVELNQRKNILFAALPTTAGTGAEVTNNAVIIDEETAIKKSIRHDTMIPDFPLIDPELTYDCPKRVVAASGLDSLTQAIECCISKKTTPETRKLASEAFLTVFNNLEKAYNGDLNAKNQLAYATMQGGIAFKIGGLGSVHGLAHPIGSLRHIAHGEACGILLEHILKINIKFVDSLAGELGWESGSKLISDIVELRNKLGVGDNFRDYNFTEKDFAFIAENCRSGSMSCNPVPMSDEDIFSLLKRIC